MTYKEWQKAWDHLWMQVDFFQAPADKLYYNWRDWPLFLCIGLTKTGELGLCACGDILCTYADLRY